MKTRPAILFALLCTLSIFNALHAFGAKPTSVPAIYSYQELLPNYQTRLTFKSTKPCRAGEKTSIIMDEWTKDTETMNPRRKEKVFIRGRNFIVRQSCETMKEGDLPAALSLIIVNDTKQAQPLHFTVLDGLEIVDVEQEKFAAKPGVKK